MLFFSFFKTLVDQQITVELKNDIEITGTLRSVDQYLNIKLENITNKESIRYPHLNAVKTLFIRGSTIRYVHLPKSAIDVNLLQDAARKEAMVSK
ncbi:Sm-like protein [Saccharomycopsis crataegensis]|uniref:LSM complex subunit LSm2 n=1 Tax=Saccharomycopsis crataegensis TaxID=43959 RepID=A0AAV5QT39_9ASCO|nr:Sm-like protein [Saccharomycopsis crataegensis]